MKYERQQIVDYCKKMTVDHLTSGTGGNISIFDPLTGFMAISPSGINYFETKQEDIVIMTLDGQIVEGKRRPSSEHNLHIALYKKKIDISSIVHTHSMYGIVLSTLNLPIKAVDYILADAGATEVPVAPYATFGTEELAQSVANTIGEGRACLMANHGMVTCGKDIESAYNLARECEWIAEIQWRAMAVGVPNIIDDTEMRNVMQRFNDYGQPHNRKEVVYD
ncbi:class II aldolase/adducin family protein [Oribacterium sp. C9]|uniref:class II aldolase/adducin family protein n=1 Tax=Oribacterium sp. C9 TaxID=1943579 RepID=UPI001FA8E51C|nr:class II aldolase/adducin family protein [Oribacterium sp. C9]